MPAEKNRIIIIDTNLWISFLLMKDFSKLEKVLSHPSCKLLFSKELYEEFEAVALRPKFRKYFSVNDIDITLSYIMCNAKFIEVTSDVKICRDIKDNFLLSLANDGKATHLITGDKDLLDIKRSGKTRIMSITDFLLKV